MQDLEGALGVPVIEAYGMTEAAHQMASNPLPPGVRKPGSVGPAAGPQVAIMSESGEILPSGKEGEIVISGPNVMDGYAANQPRTRRRSRTGGSGRETLGGSTTMGTSPSRAARRRSSTGAEKPSPRERSTKRCSIIRP